MRSVSRRVFYAKPKLTTFSKSSIGSTGQKTNVPPGQYPPNRAIFFGIVSSVVLLSLVLQRYFANRRHARAKETSSNERVKWRINDDYDSLRKMVFAAMPARAFNFRTRAQDSVLAARLSRVTPASPHFSTRPRCVPNWTDFDIRLGRLGLDRCQYLSTFFPGIATVPLMTASVSLTTAADNCLSKYLL